MCDKKVYVRIEVPDHNNFIITTTRQPSPGVCPSDGEHRPRVHAEGAERFRWAIRALGGGVEDGFGTPYAHFCVKSSCRYSRAIRVDMDGEYGEALGVFGTI